jgi:hypothetical protein
LNTEKTGKISKKEFRDILNFWCITIEDDVFDKIFGKFDVDGDGKISFKDFYLSIGMDMFPAEGLYFRQDKPQQCRINCCQQDECWQPTRTNQNFCDVHQKMHQDNSLKIFSKVYRDIGSKWNEFIQEVKNYSDPDD